MTAPLSPTMTEALDQARAHGGKLERWNGGFWTYPGCGFTDRPWGRVPDWSVSAHTVKALIARGALQVSARDPRHGFWTEVEIAV